MKYYWLESTNETSLKQWDHGCIDAWVFYATEKLHTMLEEDGAIKALLAMVRSGNIDVIAQVARGLANFAKCESRAIVQGLFLLSFHKFIWSSSAIFCLHWS